MSDNNKQKQDLQKEAENSPKDQYKDKNKETLFSAFILYHWPPSIANFVSF